MKFYEIIKNYKVDIIQSKETTIKHLSIDSRDIKENTMFFCIEGLTFDGHNYIDKVVKKGSNTIVVSKNLKFYPKDIAVVKVDNVREFMVHCASNFNNNSHQNVKMIGVTGTNGKTSIVHFLKSVLEKNSIITGSIGTVGFKVGDEIIDKSVKTSSSPDTIDLHEIINIMVKKGATHIAMEVTSHALALNKCYGINFEVGIFTNLTQDHLDFHKTMENYCDEKVKLMKKSNVSIINVDDKYANKFIENAKNKVVTYSIKNDSDFKASNIIFENNSITYNLKFNENIYNVYVPIPGEFTVYNTLATIAALVNLGLNIESIINTFKNISGVLGRMQRVENDKNKTIIIDYAHTPDALENVIKSTKNFSKGKVITVFGCGGNRDKTKRSTMGKISGQLSDFTIVTSDNPRNEDPKSIVLEIENGIKQVTKNYNVLVNRFDAIKKAIEIANEQDVVIIAGKGHENYQEICGVKHHFDDYEVAKEILESL
ncbi:MAG: UDP-N-acetylmuramoyl-L-alanyl-D-glutamate--2,6-diaminopimelate ligase [Bacilli bacterium]